MITGTYCCVEGKDGSVVPAIDVVLRSGKRRDTEILHC